MAVSIEVTPAEARRLVVCESAVEVAFAATALILFVSSPGTVSPVGVISLPTIVGAAGLAVGLSTLARVVRRNRGSVGLMVIYDQGWWRNEVVPKTGWPHGAVNRWRTLARVIVILGLVAMVARSFK